MNAPEPAARAVVAVDGPSGSGKSSVSRGVAAALGLEYLDTGAMYRAVAWWMLRHGVDVADAAAVAARAGEPVLVSGTDPAAPTIAVDGVDVSTAIREPDATAASSQVSAVPAVRARLVEVQRDAVAAARSRGRGIVVEGRDIGTVVLPDADLKVFLTADAEVRAQRRALEHAAPAGGAGAPSPELVMAVDAAMRRRDARDSTREVSPLTQAEDAVVVDATNMALPEVVDRVVALVRSRVGVRG